MCLKEMLQLLEMVFSKTYGELTTEVLKKSPNEDTFSRVQCALMLACLLLRASRSGEPVSLNYSEFKKVNKLCIMFSCCSSVN